MRARVLELLAYAYNKQHKSVAVLTGNTLDMFRTSAGDRFLQLPELLYRELSEKMLVMKFDSASGIGFYDDKDRDELVRGCKLVDEVSKPEKALGDVVKMMKGNQFSALPNLILLRGITEAFSRGVAANSVTIPEGKPTDKRADAEQRYMYRPLCIVIKMAEFMFPAGAVDRLDEGTRQRLVTFLDWITDPFFVGSDHLIVLIGESRSTINERIVQVPSVELIEVDLPDSAERGAFVDVVKRRNDKVTFEGTPDAFAKDSAGMRLTALESMLEASAREEKPVTRKAMLKQVNALLEKQLGGIITIKATEHGTKDIIGREDLVEIFEEVLAGCDDSPASAVPAVIVPGPNGVGKTFVIEGVCADSGRIVIELPGLRGSYFGETDKFFETFRRYVAAYGKIAVLVDEAHTAFGSVHDKDTHETEKRLGGNIIKMMSDRNFRGKVVWFLMTSRPDELDPDIKSRSPEQVPVFDLEGPRRESFIKELFVRRKIVASEEEMQLLFAKSGHYSARDFDELTAKIQRTMLRKKKVQNPVRHTIQNWGAASSIIRERKFQTLVAAQHCSYPELLPEELKKLGADGISLAIETMKIELGL